MTIAESKTAVATAKTDVQSPTIPFGSVKRTEFFSRAWKVSTHVDVYSCYTRTINFRAR